MTATGRHATCTLYPSRFVPHLLARPVDPFLIYRTAHATDPGTQHSTATGPPFAAGNQRPGPKCASPRLHGILSATPSVLTYWINPMCRSHETNLASSKPRAMPPYGTLPQNSLPHHHTLCLPPIQTHHDLLHRCLGKARRGQVAVGVSPQLPASVVRTLGHVGPVQPFATPT